MSARRGSTRSTSSPAGAASTATGVPRAMNSPATTMPDPESCSRRSASGMTARKSPRAETRIAALRREMARREVMAARVSGTRHGERQRSVSVASMLRVRVFGGLALESDGVALEPPASRRARELLGWLALNPGRHARAAVAARFWPDVLDASARASLRTTLHELRRALGPEGACVVADRDTVALEGARVDALEVDALLADGRADEALALQDGELLAGLEEDWVLAARDDFRERLAGRLGVLAAAADAGRGPGRA